jgi:hypothetical protein
MLSQRLREQIKVAHVRQQCAVAWVRVPPFNSLLAKTE